MKYLGQFMVVLNASTHFQFKYEQDLVFDTLEDPYPDYVSAARAVRQSIEDMYANLLRIDGELRLTIDVGRDPDPIGKAKFGLEIVDRKLRWLFGAYVYTLAEYEQHVAAYQDSAFEQDNALQRNTL